MYYFRSVHRLFFLHLRIGRTSGFRVNLLITLIRAAESGVLACGSEPGERGVDGVFLRSNEFGA